MTCQPTRWQAGETVYTWISLGSTGWHSSTVSLTFSASAPALYTLQFGPLHLLSGRYINTAPTLVLPTGATTGASGSSGVALDGNYSLALASLG